jgi:hypothetical protein
MNESLGTLVWIGPTHTDEVAEAFQYCVEHVPQLAIRRDIEHFLSFPAQHVSHVVVVRMDRRPAGQDAEKICTLAPRAACWMMLGSGCEGESRTGNPWPGFSHFYWHRWNQILPTWFHSQNAPIGRPTVLKERAVIAIMTANPVALDALGDHLTAAGHSVVYSRDMLHTPVTNVQLCIWDDTLASPTSPQKWAQRIGAINQPTSQPVHHVWLAGFPRIQDWQLARRGGIHSLISKPFSLTSIDCIERKSN